MWGKGVDLGGRRLIMKKRKVRMGRKRAGGIERGWRGDGGGVILYSSVFSTKNPKKSNQSWAKGSDLKLHLSFFIYSHAHSEKFQSKLFSFHFFTNDSFSSSNPLFL